MFEFTEIKLSHETFREFICRSIFIGTNKLVKCVNTKNLKLNENSLRNVFVTGGYEINIEKYNQNSWSFKIFKIPITERFKINLGCELEICSLTECFGDDKENANEKISLLRDSPEGKVTLRKNTWIELTQLFIKNVICKNATEEFIKKFPYIFVSYNPRSEYVDGIVDIKTGIFQKRKILNQYDYIIFTTDRSVVCGDTAGQKSNSFHFEIITPVFNNLNDFNLLYKTILMEKCLESNLSAGLHVNLSIMTENNNPIYFSNVLVDILLDYFEKYEKDNYNKLRPEKSIYAKELIQYTQEHCYKYIRSFINPKDPEYFYGNFIEGKKYYRSFIELDNKYTTLNIKDNFIMEMRIFPSTNKLNEILKYIEDSYNMLNISMLEYLGNYENRSIGLQSLNIENEISFENLKEYSGYVYFKRASEFVEMQNNIESVREGLSHLFDIHNQKVEKITSRGKNLYIVQVKSVTNRVYQVEFLGNGQFKIYQQKIKN